MEGLANHYKKIQHAKALHLWEINKQLENNRRKVRTFGPVQNPEVLQIQVPGDLRTGNIYQFGHECVLTAGKEQLGYLPFTRIGESQVNCEIAREIEEELRAGGMGGFLSEGDRQERVIENTELLTFLYEQAQNKDVDSFSQELAENTGKSSEVINQQLTKIYKPPRQTAASIQELDSYFCKICLIYLCLRHFLDEEAPDHEAHNRSNTVAPRGCPNIYAYEHNAYVTGL